ncbi:MAG: PadR family transcriptional regulator [Planctomycetes bacterium]|nr:PadR family transcriptional regulator [Planctomycetota bacterium]
MNMLSRAEEIVLLAVVKLKGNAYGITIRDEIRKNTGNEWSFAMIYNPLNRLARKRFVSKTKGDPTAIRGGRHKCLYEITDEGKKALLELRQVQNYTWNGILNIIKD